MPRKSSFQERRWFLLKYDLSKPKMRILREQLWFKILKTWFLSFLQLFCSSIAFYHSLLMKECVHDILLPNWVLIYGRTSQIKDAGMHAGDPILGINNPIRYQKHFHLLAKISTNVCLVVLTGYRNASWGIFHDKKLSKS